MQLAQFLVTAAGRWPGCAVEALDPSALRSEDMPAIAPPAVEHRLHRRRCGCGQVTGAAPPAGVNAPASYRPYAESA